jgi:hypothetical protein
MPEWPTCPEVRPIYIFITLPSLCQELFEKIQAWLPGKQQSGNKSNRGLKG